jgi:hypothetical protein
MKRIIAVVALAAALLPGLASAQTKKPVWPEMKAFHSFMSSSFHPAEEGNIAPLKAKADRLFITAMQWEASAVPSSFKLEETKVQLKKLVKQCADLKKAVAAKSVEDKKLVQMITEAHDTFHTIVGECRKAEE